MLICFGAAWPFSIYKSFKSGNNEGKSGEFLFIVFFGYLSGITHKLIHSNDRVIYLYAINASMVLADIILYFRNERRGNHS
ncbi:MAG: hypothetical protein L7F77_01320 [Candidatus Magnetominusculus sp. LBB02]|nr:hypothetical protein [Candidatus Magnetominusculus sp. LBB02]